MANSNTFSQVQQLSANFGAVETAVASAADATKRAVVAVRADILSGIHDGRPFKLRVVARAAASGAGNFVVNAYWNSAANTNLTTFTGDILVVGSGNQALATSSGVVYMEARLLWDSASGRLAAHWLDGAGLSNIVTTPAVIKTSGAITATNPIHASAVVAASDLQFFVTTSVSANGSSAKLIELALDAI
mgnify:CR=1 FL=1